MDKHELIDELKTLIGTYLKGHGLEMIDLIYRYEGRDLILRVLVDKPEGGITLDECAYLNSHISQILDNKNILNIKYILEVSSPGLDRPLLTKNDFLRGIKKNVKIFLNEPINGKIEWDGLITKIECDSVFIDAEGVNIEIPLSKVRKAKQII